MPATTSSGRATNRSRTRRVTCFIPVSARSSRKITYIDNIVAETTGLTEAQKIDQRGRILGIDKYKMVGSLQWNWNKVSTNLYVYHTPSYLNDYYSFYAAGVQRIPS